GSERVLVFQMVTRASPDTLLRTVLRSVARSFYLTLAVVPSDVRTQVGVAYLLARAADTIADTDLIERSQRLQSLTRFRERTLDDLDEYTYDAAGCVGDFWTRLMCAHRAALRAWDVEAMATVGIRFGKGLQLTNVLRDLASDLRRGRCYIPTALLEPAGLKPADLLDSATLPKFRPVLRRLLRIALEHLDQGWLYTMAIPRREVRLRLACA